MNYLIKTYIGLSPAFSIQITYTISKKIPFQTLTMQYK